MFSASILRKIGIIGIILLNIGCDQISKNIVRNTVEPRAYIQIYEDYFILSNVENTGAMLGFGENLSPILKLIFLQTLPLLVLLVLLFRLLYKMQHNKWLIMAFAFVIGGGLSNIIDRILLGYVTDFFQIKRGFFKTGILNMADVSVTMGVLLILILSFKSQKKLESEA